MCSSDLFPVAPCLEGAGQDEVLEHISQSHSFTFESCGEAYVSGSRLPCVSGTGVVVIQGLTFESPGVLVADAYPIALECFLDLLPPKVKEPKRRATKDSKASKVVPEDDVVQHPWLAEFLKPAKEGFAELPNSGSYPSGFRRRRP